MHKSLLLVTDQIQKNCDLLFPLINGLSELEIKNMTMQDEPVAMTFTDIVSEAAVGDVIIHKTWREESELLVLFYAIVSKKWRDKNIYALVILDINEVDLHFYSPKTLWLNIYDGEVIRNFLETADYIEENIIFNNLSAQFVPNGINELIEEAISKYDIKSDIYNEPIKLIELKNNVLYNDRKNSDKPYIVTQDAKVLLKNTKNGDIPIYDMSDEKVLIIFNEKILYIDGVKDVSTMLYSYLNETDENFKNISSVTLKSIIFNNRSKIKFNNLTNQLYITIDYKQARLIDKMNLGRWFSFKNTMSWIYINSLSINDLRPISLIDDVSWFKNTNSEFYNELESYTKF